MRYLNFILALAMAIALVSCDDGTPINGYGPNDHNLLQGDELTFKFVNKDGDNLLHGRNWSHPDYIGNFHIYTQLKNGEIYPADLTLLSNEGYNYLKFFEEMPQSEDMYELPRLYTNDRRFGPNVKMSAIALPFPSRQLDFDIVIVEKNIRFNVQVKYVTKTTEYTNCDFTGRYFLDGVEQGTGDFTLVI